MDSPYSREPSEPPFDSAHPFKGVVVCCTSIPPDQRAEIAKKTEELGGIHKYDLTPDVTHLVVGDYDTPKYRHVAKERSDIKAMDATWIDAVGKLWMEDVNIDFPAVEREHQLKPLETCGELPDATNPAESKRGSLLLCMTGFDDPDERNQIIERIQANGGTYTGDLTKRVSHLIVHKPEGKKFKAARNWGIRTVSLAWLDQTVERGLILDEQCFDPALPPEEQGQGAWNKVNPRRVSLGKRSRSGVVEGGQRKLRKTASMKLSSQRESLWGDILGSKPTGESSAPDRSERIEVQDSGIHDAMVQPAPDAGIFSMCYFFMTGFEPWKTKILAETIGSLGGKTCNLFEEMIADPRARPRHRFLIVPQESQPSTHYQVPSAHVDKIQIVTEFFIERCLHNKELCDPDGHVLGRPFPVFPISGFEDLSICTAGFTGIDLLHVEKAIKQIGAKYAARLNETTSVLVCKSITDTRKEKLKFAFENDVPIVGSDWLWECITTGFNAPVRTFMFSEIKQNPNLKPRPKPKEQPKETKQPIQRTRSEPIPHMPKKPVSRHTSAVGIDQTAFQDDRPKPAAPRQSMKKADSAASFQFQTAKTHQVDSFGGGTVNESSSVRNRISTVAARPAMSRTTSVADSMDPTPISRLDAQEAAEDLSEADPSHTPDKGAVDAQMSEAQESVKKDQRRKNDGDQEIVDEDGRDADTPPLGARQRKAEEEEERDRRLDEKQDDQVMTSAEGDVESQLELKRGELPKVDLEAQLKAERDAQKRAEKEDLSSKILGVIEKSAETPSNEEQPQTRRRKARVFGRAISNASVASSGSAESRIDALGRPTEEQPQEEPEPPSTQIQYEDPGAQHHRAKIRSKMLGEEVKPATSQSKIKIGGFEFDGDPPKMPRRQTRSNA
ncbi:S-M checkpoint control protein rad4 [Colletotrichum sp. SAR 10_96]|nr:S-M checkpoint control protein rad4 [Colletotrichum sp. SAR 10_96]